MLVAAAQCWGYGYWRRLLDRLKSERSAEYFELLREAVGREIHG